MIARYINLGCWLVFVLYWLATARAVKRTIEVRASFGFGYVRWIVVIAVIVLLRLKGKSSRPGLLTPLPQSDIMIVVSVVLTLAGLAVAIAARKRLAGNWSSGVVFKENHELITTGLYRYARHPIYSGVLLMALGGALGSPALTSWLFLVVVVAFLGYKARLEERLLLDHFPNEYPAYRARVKRIIPFVW